MAQSNGASSGAGAGDGSDPALLLLRAYAKVLKGVLLFQHSSFEDMSESETRYLTWVRNKIETDGKSYALTRKIL